MTYKAEFRGRAERDLVEMARSLTGLSQSAYTRAVLLQEASRILRRAQELQAYEGVTLNESTEKNTDNIVSGTSYGESSGGNLVADSATADDTKGGT